MFLTRASRSLQAQRQIIKFSTSSSSTEISSRPSGANEGDKSFSISQEKDEKYPKPTKDSQLVCNFQLSGFMGDHLDFVSYFSRKTAQQMGIPISKVIHLPTDTKKWHTVRGPFVHAKAKEVFEQKTHKRLLQAFDSHPETINAWVKYVNENLPHGVDLKVERFEWKPIGFVSRLSEPKSTKSLASTKAEQIILEAEKLAKEFSKGSAV